MSDKNKVVLTTRITGIAILSILFLYILYRNYPLFGTTMVLKEKDISDLSPTTRVKKVLIYDSNIQKQTDDLIYFSTPSEDFDKATVKVTYVASSSQDIFLGFKDSQNWSYTTKPLYLPLIENLKWKPLILTPPYIYQKDQNSNITYSDFISNPPLDKVVGTYYLDDNSYSIDSLHDYQPKKQPTKIDIPLRGSHTFYTYIENEPFSLKISKQDLNWYKGKDPLTVKIYKDQKLITEKTVDDDGIDDESRRTKDPQSAEVSYHGGLPEQGLYKIMLICSNDVVIKSIESSFSKIVFVGPVYPVYKSRIYNEDQSAQGDFRIYTNAENINFKTYHSSSYQNVKVNDSELKIDDINKSFETTVKGNRNTISLQQGDIVINGTGYFAFSKEMFFTPFIYNLYQVSSPEDLQKTDYLMTSYSKAYNLDQGWKESEVSFDIKNAYYSKRSLSWIIHSPGLKNNGNTVLIKKIEVILEKDPILNWYE